MRITKKILEKNGFICIVLIGRKVWVKPLDKKYIIKIVENFFLNDLKEYSKTLRQLRQGLTLKKKIYVYKDNIKKHGRLICYLCGNPIKRNEKSIEHKVPVSRKKDFPKININSKKNLDVAHLYCNHSKHAKTVKEYKAYLRKKKVI